MGNNSNDMLALGISILLIGLLLGSYSFSAYTEIKSLKNKIDFEALDNNNSLSTSDKYYQYLSNADFLNKKLNKNKNILMKNTSCAYLDYAIHNADGLYQLVYKKIDSDDTKQSIASGNIRTLYNMLENYNTCKKTAQYKSELKKLLDEIQNTNKNRTDTDIRMQKFLNGYQKKFQEELAPRAENSPEFEQIQPEDNFEQTY